MGLDDIDDYDDEDDFPDVDPDYCYYTHDAPQEIEDFFTEKVCKYCDFWQNGCLIVNSRYYQFNGCFEFDNMNYNAWADIMKEDDNEWNKSN
jgi:hypothetical protein